MAMNQKLMSKLLAMVLALSFSYGMAVAAPVYMAPAGGWTYTYSGDSAAAGSGSGFDALDGTWSHDAGTDEWDGTGIGSGRPGGVSALTDGTTGHVRLQETGDPRDYGLLDPGSNRKLYFGHDISGEGASNSILDDGVTLSFRARIATGSPLDDAHPDGGGGLTPWPVGGDGYVTHDGGKGNFGIKQANGGLISFSLATTSDLTGVSTGGLIMNNLNGAVITNDVDEGDPGTRNLFTLIDPTKWHEFWITIAAGGTGTHVVNIYADGSLIPTSFDVTAGSGSDFAVGYLGLGLGSTPQSGGCLLYTSDAADEVSPV